MMVGGSRVAVQACTHQKGPHHCTVYTDKTFVHTSQKFPDEGSCMLMKRWKNNCQFLASANESLVMSIPSHPGLFKLYALYIYTAAIMHNKAAYIYSS